MNNFLIQSLLSLKHTLAHRATMDGYGEWDESAHPRGRDGRWVRKFSSPSFPTSSAELKFAHPLFGSTMPMAHTDGSGRKWIVKEGGSPMHADTEHRAGEMYRSAGIFAPASRMMGGKMVAEYINGKSLGEYLKTAQPGEAQRVRDEVMRGAVVDAVLGNADPLGRDLDNIVVSPGGEVCRVDVGASLGMAANGTRNSAFFDSMPDIFSTLDHKGGAFAGANAYDLLKHAEEIPWDDVLAHATPEEKPILEKRVRHIRELAAISKNFVEDGKYTHEDNNSLVRMCHELLGRDVTSHLKPAVSLGAAVLEPTKGTRQMLMPFVEEFYHYADENGIPLKEVDDMLGDQGVASDHFIDPFSDPDNPTWIYLPGTMQLKIHEMTSMGWPLEKLAAGEMPPGASHHVDDGIKQYAQEYLNDHHSYVQHHRAYLLHKAETALALRTLALPGLVSKDGTHIFLCRTEGEDLVPNGSGVTYDRGAHESYTYAHLGSYSEGNKTIVGAIVPISRCSGLDFLPNSKGENPYASIATSSEHEIDVNAIGIPVVNHGRFDPRNAPHASKFFNGTLTSLLHSTSMPS